MNQFTVKFDFASSSSIVSPVQDLDPDLLMKSLAMEGYVYFDLVDIPGQYSECIQAKSNDVRLWVDNDSKDMAWSYLELERMLQISASWDHYILLRDGLLQISAKCINDEVDVLIERCPGLNIEYLSKDTIKVPKHIYVNTWRNAIKVFMATSKPKH